METRSGEDRRVQGRSLPQAEGGWFLTDGGIETVLIYQEGLDLPEFPAFVLLESEPGRDQLRRYYRRYLEIATATADAGFILESPTWRAGFDWGARLGYDAAAMRGFNAAAVQMMQELRAEYAKRIPGPIVVSGCVGPRGDGYLADAELQAEGARRAHQPQVDALAAAGADMITAATMTTRDEATGVARAAAQARLPAAISFTVETDGRLPSRMPLREAIETVDADAARQGYGAPAYYMINCAHPTHFAAVLAEGGAWRDRIRGLRANASSRSHAELDVMTELDAGDPADLAGHYCRLRTPLPQLNILGGCCGTDHRHVAAICNAWQTSG